MRKGWWRLWFPHKSGWDTGRRKKKRPKKPTKIGDSLSWRSWCYFEAQVWKKDSNIVPSLFFSHFLFFIWAFSIFYGLFYLFIFVRSLIPTCGGIIVSFILSSLGQCSKNNDHHTLTTQYYNSMSRTKYDSIWMPPAVYRDMQWSSVAMTSKNGQAMKTSC